MIKIVLFGAGSTGRGHLTPLLHENGCTDLTFVDRDKALIEFLKVKGAYRVLAKGNPDKDQMITGFTTLHTSEEAKIAKVCADADLILTAVIADNLGEVAVHIARSIALRIGSGNARRQDIICCENYDNASSLLKRHVYALLSPEGKRFSDLTIGFPDAIISRVVPLSHANPGFIITEDYNEWFIDAKAMKTDGVPKCITPVGDLQRYLERKFWIHNGGHAAVGFIGFVRGHRYIYDALCDSAVAELASATMDEIGAAVVRKHGFPAAEIDYYKKVFVGRGLIAEMKDDILRVVRNPIRKLGPHDRLLAPAIYAKEQGLPYGSILQTATRALLFRHETDEESIRLTDAIARTGVRKALDEVLGLGNWPELADELAALYETTKKTLTIVPMTDIK